MDSNPHSDDDEKPLVAELLDDLRSNDDEWLTRSFKVKDVAAHIPPCADNCDHVTCDLQKSAGPRHS